MFDVSALNPSAVGPRFLSTRNKPLAPLLVNWYGFAQNWLVIMYWLMLSSGYGPPLAASAAVSVRSQLALTVY